MKTIENNEKNNNYFLDEMLKDFFPKEGCWKSNCFKKSNLVSDENLPCHLRDSSWLADLILKKYNIYYLEKEEIIKYINNSEQFNKLREEYEQKIVSWQIEWMRNDGEYWIVDENLGGDLYMFSPKCDYAFRKGIVDTLLAIGIDIDAIEEGIEKNISKWREDYMRLAFYNLYREARFSFYDKEKVEEPSQEHYEKWRKLRLYEYYIKHKDSVDKYGVVLPEMQMTESEVKELKKWLDEAHKERMKQIEEFNKTDFSNIFQMHEIDYYGCDIASSKELNNLHLNEKKNKSLIKRLFRKN